MTSCIFCQIAAAQLPAHRVFEDENLLAFLDRRPLFHGHTLLIPKLHIESLHELPPRLMKPLMLASQRLALAMVSALEAEGTFVAMNNLVSQSVPHLHIHVVPRRPKDGLRGFFWPRTRYDNDTQSAEVAAKLRLCLDQFG